MAILTIDPTKVGILPAGDYNAYISKPELKISEKGNQYYNIEYTLEGNRQHDGRKVYQVVSVESQNFLLLLTALGFSFPENQTFQFDDRFLGGKHCRVRVIHEDYTDSKGQSRKSAKVSDVMPPVRAAQKTAPVAEDDDYDGYVPDGMPF